jgi:hypothetical protein
MTATNSSACPGSGIEALRLSPDVGAGPSSPGGVSGTEPWVQVLECPP